MDFFKKIEAALKKIGEHYVSELKNRLLRDGNVASKDLARSINSKVVSDGVEITANRYLLTVSEGKKASTKGGPSQVMVSRAMVSRISKWMKHKGIKPRGYGGLTELKYKKAAFAIAISINRKGFEGSRVIARSFRGIEDNIDSEITNALKSTLELLVEDVNKDIKKK